MPVIETWIFSLDSKSLAGTVCILTPILFDSVTFNLALDVRKCAHFPPAFLFPEFSVLSSMGLN